MRRRRTSPAKDAAIRVVAAMVADRKVESGLFDRADAPFALLGRELVRDEASLAKAEELRYIVYIAYEPGSAEADRRRTRGVGHPEQPCRPVSRVRSARST
jgi:hypothetical protein